MPEGWRWRSHKCTYTQNTHISFLWWPVWYWGSSSFFLFFFFSIFAAFIPRRFGKRVQDVWVVEASAEVSLCCLMRLRTFVHFVCVCRPGYVCIKGIYRAGLAPASEARLFLPGFLLLEVVSSPLATVISCHFLGFWKETLACFLTRPVSCITELVAVLLPAPCNFNLIKRSLGLNLLTGSLSLSHTRTRTDFPSSVLSSS